MSIYQQGKIYKLINEVDDEIYIGSSCNNLAKRLSGHKMDAIKWPERHVYKHLNDIGWENVKIILIERYKCDSKIELLKRERYWIDELKPSLNKQLATRTLKEYYEDNKKMLLQNKKEYYIINKEVISEKKKQYTDNNKEKVSSSRKCYYENNKDKIHEKQKEKYTCEVCECELVWCAKARHEKTMKHMNNLKDK